MLLASCSCTADRLDIGKIGDTGGYKNDEGASIYVLLDEYEHRNDLTDTDKLKILGIRRWKRSDTSFTTAWETLAKSTIGFARLEIRGRDTKVFAKVGTTVDATNDFYSLAPINSVNKLASGLLLGFVESHSIGLKLYGNSPMLYVLNGSGVEKVINYYENGWKARVALVKWKTFSYIQ